jgi:hypothetical protein
MHWQPPTRDRAHAQANQPGALAGWTEGETRQARACSQCVGEPTYPRAYVKSSTHLREVGDWTGGRRKGHL